VGFLVYWGLYILKKFRKNLRASILMTIVFIIMIYGIVSVFIGGSSINFFASTAGRSATLTGRTEIWAALLPVAMQKPIIGNGFGGFWTSRTREVFQISEAHNGYLEVILTLGFVGILLVSIFLLSCCRKAQRELSNNFDWGVLYICYIIMAVVHNIGESSIDTLTSQLMAVVLFLSVSSTSTLSRRQRR
jgi:O-antigen ligase